MFNFAEALVVLCYGPTTCVDEPISKLCICQPSPDVFGLGKEVGANIRAVTHSLEVMMRTRKVCEVVHVSTAAFVGSNDGKMPRW